MVSFYNLLTYLPLMKVPNLQIHDIKHPLNNQQKNQKLKIAILYESQ